MNGYLKHIAMAHVDTIVTVSPALHSATAKWYPLKTILVPCGIRDDIFQPPDEAFRTKLRQDNGVMQDDIVFLFLGSIGRRKGFDLLAQAFAQLIEVYPNWHLWVIGPKSKSENQNISNREVEAVIEPLRDLDKQVFFWGRVNDRHLLAQLLGAGDVFVFPSRREGMGIAPLEAMAVGVPPIIARIPGVTDLANIDGETGLYVQPGDMVSLKAAMESLGSNRSLRIKMGEKARQRIIKDFSWARHVTQWENLYMYGEIGSL